MGEILLLAVLVGAIAYTRYNRFKVNRDSEEMYRIYKAELEEIKQRERIKEILNK